LFKQETASLFSHQASFPSRESGPVFVAFFVTSKILIDGPISASRIDGTPTSIKRHNHLPTELRGLSATLRLRSDFYIASYGVKLKNRKFVPS
jgi:hypothetical protein